MMLLASVFGAVAGVFYTALLNPLNNYYIFLAIFAMIGITLANVVLLALYEAYEWLEKRYENVESPKTSKHSNTEC